MRFSEINESKAATDRLGVSISIVSRLEQVALARAALGGALQELSVPEQDAILLLLAVTEVINNAIEHGYKCEPDKQVEILLASEEHEIRIEIFDDAPPLPVNELKQMLKASGLKGDADVPADDWTERGHGLHIIRRAVDSMAFSRISDRNCVTLHKRLG